MKAMDRLIDIMETLRAPGGCPWDAEQDHKSIMRCAIEEAYELADAIENESAEDMKEELGDVLLQVVFHSLIARDNAEFELADVVELLCDKLIYRHPHVFGSTRVADADEVKVNWDRLKRKENGKTGRKSILEGVPETLPALLFALKIQSAASRAGFDWADAGGVAEKITEEVAEVSEAVENGEEGAVFDEIGDLIFSVVNLSRMLGVDPEAALRRSNKKFMTRFAAIEDAAEDRDIPLSEMPMAEKERIWQRTKKTD
ncbi:MAG: nucleoside triphosphate pyrophosphohydrolase [Thermodesulfobacteriota bacterium]